MVLTAQQTFFIIAVISIGTILTRALPFILFHNTKEMPRYILYLGKVIPFAAIGMLIVYCLKNVSLINAPFGIPEIISILLVILLHLWRNNTLISIGGGTILYMVLVQVVFI